jgi:uncharacterized protein (DUF58 family)
MSSTPSLSPERTPPVWRRAGALIAGRAARWARRRQGVDPVPVELASRRIYILPTGVGITYALMVFAMLLGSMNYNNSMAFALTFLLAALGLVAMHHCQRNVAGLIVAFTGAEPVFAGDPVRLRFALHNEGVAPRFDILVYVGESASSRVDVPSGGHALCVASLPTTRRGRLRLTRYGVRSTHPLTLFRAWAWIHADVSCLVWPRPAQEAPPLPFSAPSHGRRRTAAAGDDDFAGLRDFQDGDPPRHLAWKTYARSGELKTKRFSGTEARLAWLDIRDAQGSDLEERLSVVCRWVLDAERAGLRYGLRLGRTIIQPSRGNAHRARCLDALAEFEGGRTGGH